VQLPAGEVRLQLIHARSSLCTSNAKSVPRPLCAFHRGFSLGAMSRRAEQRLQALPVGGVSHNSDVEPAPRGQRTAPTQPRLARRRAGRGRHQRVGRVVALARCEGDRDGGGVAAYSRLLHDPRPAVREQAARDWCAWEDTHVAIRPDHRPDPRYDAPRFRMAFARLVTHYWRHAAWLEDGALLRDAGRLAGIRGVLVHGRLDLSSPLDIAWHLSRAWPGSELVVVDEAGHGWGDPGTREALIAATDRFAVLPQR
ncbi:MAG: hypothetical protein ACR2JY_20170, partial [Chloroflexota bacterium]